MSFDLQTLEITDIERAQKQNVRLAESLDMGSVLNTDKPLSGVVSKQNSRVKDIGDILNIGAGTRCKHCGLLHFMFVEKCSSCKKPMEYNLGTRNEEARW